MRASAHLGMMRRRPPRFRKVDRFRVDPPLRAFLSGHAMSKPWEFPDVPRMGVVDAAGGGAALTAPPPVNTPPQGTPEGTRTSSTPALGMQLPPQLRDDRDMNLDTVIETLRDARRALLFHDFEARVAAYYKVEDAAAELSALLLTVDPREL